VFVMNVCHSLATQDAHGFHPEAMYELKVDGDGDAVEELTYRITFGENDAIDRQLLQVRRITRTHAADPHAPGIVLAEGSAESTVDSEDGSRLRPGKAGDPFWVEPHVLHAVGAAFQHGTRVDLSRRDPASAKNLFAGQTLYSPVLKVPDTVLPVAVHERRIGFWGLTTLATDVGGWRPINRAGLPMPHPLFIQLDENHGNRRNGGRPADNHQTFGQSIAGIVAGVVAAYGTADDPRAYSQMVASRISIPVRRPGSASPVGTVARGPKIRPM
jgi:hypothetical protein